MQTCRINKNNIISYNVQWWISNRNIRKPINIKENQMLNHCEANTQKYLLSLHHSGYPHNEWQSEACVTARCNWTDVQQQITTGWATTNHHQSPMLLAEARDHGALWFAEAGDLPGIVPHQARRARWVVFQVGPQDKIGGLPGRLPGQDW